MFGPVLLYHITLNIKNYDQGFIYDQYKKHPTSNTLIQNELSFTFTQAISSFSMLRASIE